MSYGTPNHTAAYKLFHYYNTWLVPANAAMSGRTIEMAGYLKHPNPQKDREISEALTPVYITTARAAELMEGGSKLVINDPYRAKDIFKVISEHLLDWRDYLREGDLTFEIKPPLDGLIEFHRLATNLLFVARGHGYYEDKKKKERKFQRLSFKESGSLERNAHGLTVNDDVIKEIIVQAARYGVRPSLANEEFLLANEGEHEASRGAIPNVREAARFND